MPATSVKENVMATCCTEAPKAHLMSIQIANQLLPIPGLPLITTCGGLPLSRKSSSTSASLRYASRIYKKRPSVGRPRKKNPSGSSSQELLSSSSSALAAHCAKRNMSAHTCSQGDYQQCHVFQNSYIDMLTMSVHCWHEFSNATGRLRDVPGMTIPVLPMPPSEGAPSTSTACAQLLLRVY